ncbi:hypothetical protein ACFQLX_09090 [Streptomyces polyrhachis]|uniref:Excreted virulence factor EspC (Type VII ESX diderm) n=1 Tax=Streptomyces polyrhachis TaxID=1282885 RepID=A0ABW2GBW6_9ACTN
MATPEVGATTGIAAAVSAGALAAMSARNLKVGYDSMTEFRAKIGTILDGLRGSPGARSSVGDQQVDRAALGSGGEFPEADALAKCYAHAQAQLVQLAETADRLIDALGIAVDGAARGYQNLDEDERRRFHSVNTEVYEQREEFKAGRADAHRTDKKQQTF